MELATLDPLGTPRRGLGSAVLHLAWVIDRKRRNRVLLAGAVELLPSEIPPPEPQGERFGMRGPGCVI